MVGPTQMGSAVSSSLCLRLPIRTTARHSRQIEPHPHAKPSSNAGARAGPAVLHRRSPHSSSSSSSPRSRLPTRSTAPSSPWQIHAGARLGSTPRSSPCRRWSRSSPSRWWSSEPVVVPDPAPPLRATATPPSSRHRIPSPSVGSGAPPPPAGSGASSSAIF